MARPPPLIWIEVQPEWLEPDDAPKPTRAPPPLPHTKPPPLPQNTAHDER